MSSIYSKLWIRRGSRGSVKKVNGLVRQRRSKNPVKRFLRASAPVPEPSKRCLTGYQ